MAENPRQFSSIDNGDRGMGESLANRPRTGTPISEPEDFEKVVEAATRLKQIEKDKGTYVKRTTEVERAFEAEQKAARDEAFRKSVKEAKVAQEIQAAKEQAARAELFNQIKGDRGTPHPYDTESDINRARRLSGLPPIDDPPPTASANSRQPLPSSSSPPPTPKGTAARASALVEPTQTPAPAVLREALPVTGGILQATLPKSLPQAAGRLVPPAVGASLVLAGRLMAGQPIGQAVTGTAGTLVGSGVGMLVGSALAGPLGTVVGGMVGGFVGGFISDSFFNQQLPTTGSPPRTELNYPPFIGGQAPGIYKMECVIDCKTKPGGVLSSSTKTISPLIGPIKGYRPIAPTDPGQEITYGIAVEHSPSSGDPYIYWQIGQPSTSNEVVGVRNIKISRIDGLPDDYQIKNVPTPPPDNLPYRYDTSPIGGDNTVPSGSPQAGIKKGKTRNVAPTMPANNTPNGSPFFPGHAGLAPTNTPNPSQYPSNLGGMLPAQEKLPENFPQQLPFVESKDIPAPRFGLQITPSTGDGGIVTPATITPATITPATVGYAEGTDREGNYISPEGVKNAPDGTVLSSKDQSTFPAASVPSPLQNTRKASAISDSISPTPKAQSAPITKTPEQIAADKQTEIAEQNKKDIAKLTEMAAIIAGLTPILQGLPNAIATNPNIRAANRDDVQSAVCEVSQPGGCLGWRHDQTQQQNADNASKLDTINAALNVGNLGANAQLLAGQQTILQRLGDQVPGGISGFMNRIIKNKWVDRSINLITMTAAVHNVVMLSDQPVTTFFGILDNVLAIPALIVDPNAETIDTKQAFGGVIDEFFKNIFGVAEWAEIKKRWQTANRIYQAAANGANEIRSIGGNIISAVEQTARLTGKGFNAMQDEGLLSEANWDYSPENLKLKGGLFAKFGKLADGINIATEGLEAIESITSEIRSAVDSANQIKENATEIDNGVKELFNQSKTKREEEVEALPDKSYSWEDLV